MTQLGVLTLGPTGGTQLALQPDGQIQATIGAATTYSISASGNALFTTISGTTGTFSGVLSAQSTSTFTGLATFNGGITTAGATTLVQTTVKLADGACLLYTSPSPRD